MNRYIDRYIAAFVFLLAWASTGYSQIKLEGPAEVKSGKSVAVRIVIDKGDDLKLCILKDQKAFTGTSFRFKDLNDGQNVLLFTDTEDGVYTVAAGVNAEGKTYLAVHSFRVGSPEPPKPPAPGPDGPKPEPKSTLGVDIQKSYTSNPDAEALAKLIEVFVDTKAYLPNLKSYGDLETSIAATAKDRLKSDTKLRAVRDRIGDYLIEKTGTDPRKWDSKKAAEVCEDILAALKGVK